MNMFVLVALTLLLSACSMDIQLQNGSSSSKGGSRVVRSSIVSFQLQQNGSNSDVYYSNDQTNFSLLQSIPGDFKGSSFSDYGYRGDLKDNGFIIIEKNGSSPAGWADRSLWYVGTQTESIKKYIDLPVSFIMCDMANHTGFLNMYCRDGSYNYLIYQVDKNSKALVSVIDKWGYVGDSTYDFVAEPLYSRVRGTTETVGVFKVLKSDTSVKELVDLYVYTGSDFRKVIISGPDLAALNPLTLLLQYEQVTVGAKELLFMSAYISNSSAVYLLVVDVSDPSAPSLSKHLQTYSSEVLGVIGDKVVLKPGAGTYYQTYSTASGVQDTTIVKGDITSQVHGNSIFVAGSGTSFKKCDINGTCSTLVSDFSRGQILTFVAEGFQQDKIYFIDESPNEADRVIQSVDVATGAVVTETVLTNILKAKSIGMGRVRAISRYGDNISVDHYDDAGRKYLLLNKNDLAVKDEFLDYCSGNSDFPIKNHKYFTPLFEGWNKVMEFICL